MNTMKTNKLLLGLLVAGMFVGCTNDDADNGLNLPSGEVKTSYIALSVNAAVDMNRAVTDGGFDEGESGEQKVTNAHFFFFNSAGGAFAINSESKEAGDGDNYIVRTVSDNGNKPNNIETITEAVVTIKNNKGEIPASVLAVLNWDYSGAAIDLATLKAELVDLAKATEGANGFIMSNSVYVADGVVIESTPIAAVNVASSDTDALASPVDIYVERLASKVTLKQDGTSFDTGIALPGGTGNIQAKIKGWALNTTIDKSNLVKNVSADWIASAPFAGWNDILNYRSYWAVSANAGVAYAKEFSYNGLTQGVDTPEYCLENTDNSNTTKVIVAAEFFDGNDNRVQVAKFYGQYLTFDALKEAVANSFSSTYYYDNGAEKVSIAPEQIEFTTIESTDIHDSYKVSYKLTGDAASKNWYLADGTTPVDVAIINAELAKVEKAQAWNGMGYYFVNVEHLGGKLGIVRNHSYLVNVAAISGLGTAVYDGNKLIEEPVTPTDSESYIAARINVLSWKVIDQDVTLQ